MNDFEMQLLVVSHLFLHSTHTAVPNIAVFCM
jgi:hypothetical protein